MSLESWNAGMFPSLFSWCIKLKNRAFAIDEFEYSSGSQVVISKVLWHPLGEGGESLWILTSDGRLQYVSEPTLDSRANE